MKRRAVSGCVVTGFFYVNCDVHYLFVTCLKYVSRNGQAPCPIVWKKLHFLREFFKTMGEIDNLNCKVG